MEDPLRLANDIAVKLEAKIAELQAKIQDFNKQLSDKKSEEAELKRQAAHDLVSQGTVDAAGERLKAEKAKIDAFQIQSTIRTTTKEQSELQNRLSDLRRRIQFVETKTNELGLIALQLAPRLW